MIELKTDDTSIRKVFEELSPSHQKQAYKKAIRTSLNILKKHAISNLQEIVQKGAINKRDKYGNTLKKGIKIRIYKNATGGKIHIMGNYKLKFFELGTRSRYNTTFRGKRLKKKRFTGRIPTYAFFTNAKNESESEMLNQMDRLIYESIKKVNDKYKNRGK